jgi:hypothetical protein
MKLDCSTKNMHSEAEAALSNAPPCWLPCLLEGGWVVPVTTRLKLGGGGTSEARPNYFCTGMRAWKFSTHLHAFVT